jgi:TolA-binding protein
MRRAWLVAVFLPGCVTQAEGERMKADMSAMRAQLDSVKKGIDADRDALQKAVTHAEEKTKELEDTLEHFNSAARRTDADFGMQMDRLQQTVQELSGKLEESQFRLDRAEKQSASAPAAAPVPAVPGESHTRLPADKAQARQLVVQLLGRGDDRQHDDGKRLANELLAKWPKDEGTSDVVRFALGDRLAEDKLYQKAQVEYKKVLDDFPKGSRADNAMFKIAQTFIATGQYEDAKVFLEELLRRWPKSPLAKESRIKLAELAKKKPVAKKR